MKGASNPDDYLGEAFFLCNMIINKLKESFR